MPRASGYCVKAHRHVKASCERASKRCVPIGQNSRPVFLLTPMPDLAADPKCRPVIVLCHTILLFIRACVESTASVIRDCSTNAGVRSKNVADSQHDAVTPHGKKSENTGKNQCRSVRHFRECDLLGSCVPAKVLLCPAEEKFPAGVGRRHKPVVTA